MPVRMLIAWFVGLVVLGLSAQAAEFETEHNLVLHVNTDDPVSQKIAINNATNLLKYYGPGNVTIEIVAHGPGLSILMPDGKEAHRIPGLLKSGVTFNACEVTMAQVKNRTGNEVNLIEGVKTVPAGVAYIMELQEKGFSYVKP